MTIEAKVILDSISPAGIRLTTMQLKYARLLHAEYMTHRVFSRNASSSRAIPVSRMLDDIVKDPATPVHWGKNQSGMQARAELDQPEKVRVQALWNEAMLAAVEIAGKMAELGAHKQVVNRILEPFQHMSVIMTSTEWDNWYALRDHEDADPNIQALAKAMKEAHTASTPGLLKPGEWHLPYLSSDEISLFSLENAKKASAARCARVSYLRHDGLTPGLKEDLELFERLVGSDPKHCSPVEHQATPQEDPLFWGGNFRGWRQHRQEIEGQLD